jgi:signal transduction histidine kinase/CheY-like chemotaxis protein
MIAQLFRLHPSSLPGNNTSELAQTKVRLAILVVIATYVFCFGASFQSVLSLAPWAQIILLYYACYTPFALALYWSALSKPGHYPARRLAGMALDYGSLGFSIIIEPVIMMPLHTVILWITVGNGMRYGQRYLWIANAFALTTTGVVLAVVPASTSSPFMVIMLMLSVIAIPQYAASLLKRIEKARREAEAANLAKSQILAQASHDLRQPLHAIGLFTASLRRTGLNQQQDDIVDRIDRSLHGVAQLFRALLDLSTLDSGAISPKPEAVSVGDLMAEIVQQNLQQAEWKAIELRFVDTDKIVFTDKVLLTAMVQNLISNALKFSNGHSVLVGCRQKGTHLSIAVFDQGVGIEPAHLPHVFEQFYQVKHTGDTDRQGVGLGLSIVARMADLLNLEVSATSALGRGSCFTIANLTVLEKSEKKLVNSQQGHSQMSKTPIADISILLVEDDADILIATQELLNSWGCRTTASATIPGHGDDFDLIITDYDLGEGKTGLDCIAMVRKRCNRQMPAIILTGHDDSHIWDESADGAIPILKKPIRPAELRSAISTACVKLRQQSKRG